jgi:hypothetical protein
LSMFCHGRVFGASVRIRVIGHGCEMHQTKTNER